jgi:hypothetical protein
LTRSFPCVTLIMAKPLNIHNVYMHYEKLCLLHPHCLAIGAPKQLIYNYTTSSLEIWWINKKECHVKKSKSCIVVASWLQKTHVTKRERAPSNNRRPRCTSDTPANHASEFRPQSRSQSSLSLNAQQTPSRY